MKMLEESMENPEIHEDKELKMPVLDKTSPEGHFKWQALVSGSFWLD